MDLVTLLQGFLDDPDQAKMADVVEAMRQQACCFKKPGLIPVLTQLMASHEDSRRRLREALAAKAAERQGNA